MMSSNNITGEYCHRIVDNASFLNLMKRYESFFHDVIDGKCGSLLAIYVYLINTWSDDSDSDDSNENDEV